MAKYFIDPFGVSGDLTPVPDAAPIDGSVSYESGFGPEYQLDPDSDPSALNVPRAQFNQIMFDVTSAIQFLQQFGFPAFITSSDNGGTPFPYSKGATVRWTDESNYESQVDTNTTDPTNTTNWKKIVYAIPELTGVSKKYWGSSLPSGYVWENGTTIGDASSNATGRANADTFDLFSLLWSSTTDVNLPIFTSAGASSTRGVSATADFNAHKRLSLPDSRGRVSAGKDDMGGVTPAGRLTTGGSGISGSSLAAAGGFETNTLDVTMIPAHHHTTGYIQYGIPTSSGTPINSVRASGLGFEAQTSDTGDGLAHNNTQPTIVCNWIIKL